MGVCELLGAALAVMYFKLVRPEEFGGSESGATGLLSEFIGTFMLVLTVGLNVIGKSKAAVFSIAASLMCMIFSLGSVSCAYFNPAVTTAVVCAGRGKITLRDAALYIFVQLLGGIGGALTYAAMEGGATASLKPSGSSFEAGIAELIFTFLLSFVVLSVATIESPLSEYFGLAIGSCVTAGGLAIGSISGGSLNPAVSVGLAVADQINSGPMRHCVTYTIMELLGGAVAAGTFRATRPNEYGPKMLS